MSGSDTANFIYKSCAFDCRAELTESNLFRPKTSFISLEEIVEPFELIEDCLPYASEAEAIRHAQQHAVRWVHDRTGHGQGQF